MARKAAPRGQTLAAAPSGDSESVRIRKIENGWLISRSSVVRGRYKETEHFSAERPTVTAPATKSAARAKSGKSAARR